MLSSLNGLTSHLGVPSVNRQRNEDLVGDKCYSELQMFTSERLTVGVEDVVPPGPLR